MPRPAYSSPYVWWSWLTGKKSDLDRHDDNDTYGRLYSQRSAVTVMRAEDADLLPGRADSGPISKSSTGEADKDPETRAKIAAAKMMGILKAKEKFRVSFDPGLYGAAVVIPQIARSAGWPKNLAVLSIRSFMFLVVNYIAQGCILYMIAKEENVWDLFAGQMYLCDFGRDANNCPDGPDCVGPGGTLFSAPRVYSWDLWTTRMYVRDSLVALFPHMKDEIHKNVDPGEYGVESYWCRLLCCTLFTVTVMSDLWGSINIMRVLVDIPNQAEYWIDYEVPEWADKDHAKAIHGWSELDLVALKIAGMSLHWKILNVFVVLIPKLLLWKVTAEAGICFLMETSGIEDIVVNSVALAFILQIDELLCCALMSDTTRAILGKIEDYHLEDYDKEIAVESMTDEELLERYDEQKTGFGLSDLWDTFPVKLCFVFLLTFFFVELYYVRHCVTSETGGRVSHSMRLPLSTDFTFFNAFFQHIFPVAMQDKPFWTMPNVAP